MRSTKSYLCATTILAAGLCAFGSAPASAQTSTAQGTSRANIVVPVQITKIADLAFGSIVAPASGTGRVTINARTGARTSNVNASPVGTGFSRGRFVVTGRPNTAVNLTVGSPTIQLTGPGAPMVVDQLRVNRNNGGPGALPRVYTIPASGTMNVGFGGRLTVPTGQAPGNYTGTFDLTVTYQ
ncbi:DUF4402 domain-containing protein [Parerythrobacter lacustris]|uniref:DUF4402 domain-containing protein n=1 Tax=Parerythrobacter lacustris TaxID=2969984 RepID=A0ABT1XU36_9SPHN|nr:DUF4402 domain-containing protein [Parerythrobacter lacustris]MCR2835152.1 DUF4402 domain-containing protein [Parerythrobacter lacustris]